MIKNTLDLVALGPVIPVIVIEREADAVPLARALYATVEVDEVIPREHFDAAAKIIGFVFQSRKRR